MQECIDDSFSLMQALASPPASHSLSRNFSTDCSPPNNLSNPSMNYSPPSNHRPPLLDCNILSTSIVKSDGLASSTLNSNGGFIPEFFPDSADIPSPIYITPTRSQPVITLLMDTKINQAPQTMFQKSSTLQASTCNHNKAFLICVKPQSVQDLTVRDGAAPHATTSKLTSDIRPVIDKKSEGTY